MKKLKKNTTIFIYESSSKVYSRFFNLFKELKKILPEHMYLQNEI